MTGGLAMRMRFELSQLARRHGIETPTPNPLSLAAPTDDPLVVEGIAAHANSIDSTRQMFASCAFILPAIPSRMPKLLYRHDDQQPAGKIDELFFDRDGNLRLRATVTHELGKRAPALSVGVTVLNYEIKNADTKDFHALITRAAIPTEISLTVSPANRHALVTRRYPQPAAIKTYDLGIQGVRKCMQIVDELRRINAQPPEPPAPATLKARRALAKPPPREPHRVGSFGALVRAIEQQAGESP